MTFEFRDAVRKDVSLLMLIAGGTASGKTESAMRIATGLSGGEKFAVIDTESGRALHKADDYTFQHVDLDEPFTPERYTEALKAAQGFPVVVIDSGSHVYEGTGGLLDQQAEEFKRLGEREGARMSSWIKPKQRHKKFVQALLRHPGHVVMCLRAEDKIEIVKDAGGKTIVRPKESLVGAQGWIPICEKRLPFEATISLLLTADAPGIPKPIKLERRHKDLIPLDRELDESVGKALAAWAAGSKSEGTATGRSDDKNGSAERKEREEQLAALTSWAEVKAVCDAEGIREHLADVAANKFHGRDIDTITPDEWAALVADVRERASVGAAT